MVMIPNLRAAKKDDAPDIADLATQLGYPTSAEQSLNRLNVLLALPGNAVFVATLDDGPVVGWAHVFVTFRVESDPFSELGGLVVGEQFRGRGIGKALVTASAEWARKRGIYKLRVRCRSERTATHAFYRHLGFSCAKEQNIFDKALRVNT